MQFKKEGNTGIIYIYNDIYSWDGRMLPYLESELKSCNSVELRVNSPGGAVFTGMPFYNMLSRIDKPVKAYVDGMAASIASVIIMAADEIYMASNAFLMLHQSSSGLIGQSQDMKDMGDLLEKINGAMTDVYMRRTGKSREEVTEWLQHGRDKWFSAQEALEDGLIDGITDAIGGEPVDISDPSMAFRNFAASLSSTKQQNDDSKMKGLFAALGISPDAKEEAAIAALNQLKLELANKNDEIKALKTSLDAEKASVAEAKAETLVEAAFDSGKIDAKQKEHFLAIAKNDYESTKGILDNMPVYKPITGQLDGKNRKKGKDLSAKLAEREEWAFSEWQKKDPAALREMQEKMPEEYEALKSTLQG